MKKILLLATAFLPFIVSGQTIFSDDFESYSPGDLVAASSPTWTTWSGGVASEDAPVSDDQSSSGSNSIYIKGNTGPTDLVLPFPSDFTSGVYELSLKIFIVTAKGAYYNFQQSAVPGVDWMFEVYYDNAGGGFINAGGSSSATVSYTPNAWNDNKIVVDLDNDKAEFFINSKSVHTWQWSLGALGTSSAKMWGGMDIFAYAANGGDAEFYVDDVNLSKVQAVCPAPVNLEVGNVTSTTATVQWGAVTDAKGYKINYHPANKPSSIKKSSTTNSKTLKNLSPNTKYKWAVQTICNNNPTSISTYVMGPDFTTPPFKLSDNVNAITDIQIFPNPASDAATIAFSVESNSTVAIRLVDVSGRLVSEIETSNYSIGNHQLSFNTAALPSGIYMVQLKTNDEVITKRLIVER